MGRNRKGFKPVAHLKIKECNWHEFSLRKMHAWSNSEGGRAQIDIQAKY
jgi:hypothetical protein